MFYAVLFMYNIVVHNGRQPLRCAGPQTRNWTGAKGTRLPPVRYRLLCLLLYLITNDTVLKIARATHMPSVHSSESIQVKAAVS